MDGRLGRLDRIALVVDGAGWARKVVDLINLHVQGEGDVVTDHLKSRVRQEVGDVVLGGGVSANSEIRKQLKKKEKTDRWKVYLPPFEYTTDNAAMIGMVGYLKAQEKRFSDYTAVANPRLSF